jgi:hypothetical protein
LLVRKGIGIGVVAALALIALVPATASAERGGTETRVVIDAFMTDINRDGGNDGAWTGRVTAPDADCVSGRRVTLFMEKSDGKKKIGSTKTVNVRRGNTGFWGIEAPKPKRGTYFAKVKGSNGCTGDTSQNFKYPKDQPL